MYDDASPAVDIFYQPQVPYLPAFRLQFRSSMAALLNLAAVEAMTADISRALGIPLRCLHVSQVELTIDFPGGADRIHALRQELYVPRARSAQSRDADDWWCWGSRYSAGWVRLYAKREEGLYVARFEYVLNRDRLRALAVHSLADLRMVDWATVVARCVRFVELVPPGRGRNRVAAKMLAAAAGVEGTHTTLRKARPAVREKFRRRLRATKSQDEVAQALTTMQQLLRAEQSNRVPMKRPPRMRLQMIPSLPG